MPDLPTILSWIRDESETLRQADLWRTRRTAAAQGPWIEIEGRRLANFASNDYLALASDERVRQAAVEASGKRWGSAASPVLGGRGPAHEELENALARFEGTEAALVFSSGYAANVGTITALAGPGDVVFCDRLNHASLIDGCRLSRARMRVYPHSDADRLGRLMRHESSARRRFIVTDAVFSMDGDLAPLGELADLADRFDAALLVDEAHGTGVYGKRGRGVAEHLGLEECVAVKIGTLSKAIGSAGGFVAGPQALIEWLVNRARTYIYSTAPPAAVCAAATAALRIVEAEPERRARLFEHACRLRDVLAAGGIDTGSQPGPIVPVLVGDSGRASRYASALEARGLLVPAIRPPTVPRGTARLRINVTAGHDGETIERLAHELVGLLDERRTTTARVL